MKVRRVIFSCLLLLAGLALQSNDYFLLPGNFMLHKGEIISVHLFSGQGFEKDNQEGYKALQTGELMLYEGKRKTNLKTSMNDSIVPVMTYALKNAGLALMAMTSNYTDIETDKATLIAELNDEGDTKFDDQLNSRGQARFKERVTCYMKTFFTVDQPDGSLYGKELGHTLEIILQQNPYQLNYGDDIAATIKFKGKGLAKANVDMIVKTAAGSCYTQRSSSDAAGNVYFKLSREGIYMLRLVNIQPSAIKGADFDKWAATCTFAFKNAGILPNNYRGFGLGNKH